MHVLTYIQNMAGFAPILIFKSLYAIPPPPLPPPAPPPPPYNPGPSSTSNMHPILI